MNVDIKSLQGGFTLEDHLQRFPTVINKCHPNNTLMILGFAASNERRALLNQQVDLGGIKFSYHQFSADGKLLFNTFVYPLELKAHIFRGRTNFAVILDAQIRDKFMGASIDINDEELKASVHRGLLTSALALDLGTADMYFEVNL